MNTEYKNFSRLLHLTSRALRMAIDRRLKYLGLSQASWVAVAAIAGAQTPLSQSELAQFLGVEGATIVTMVDRLVKTGLVQRVPTLADRRKKLLVVTADGKALYEKVRSEADALGEEILDKVAESDLQVAMRVLAEVYAATESLS
ncbi:MULTISPECIES: MarR family winged helix-turn-helix transcriptional regulator [Sodalis]|jgi:MarR family transcriptional regulator for hemolysin|uniref:MarR family transcriptional regulator for hemolysin n=1 Tax=Sodalis ligni TaxID=2697027 RepID=A0A4R1N5L9_9GAMM|nr:MarR family transcriptional regulator [Sodalis ligni]TCL02403.1 MarR family transcriptional regulator for hemolysin [Sodalis ligni]